MTFRVWVDAIAGLGPRYVDYYVDVNAVDRDEAQTKALWRLHREGLTVERVLKVEQR